jgi:hypothetical protein
VDIETLPPAPPEAELIRLAREALGMKASAAARRMAETCPPDAAITAGYWRDIERGAGGRRGQRVTVRASDSTLAHMAVVVGVTPERLEKAGREKAAAILREIHSRDGHDWKHLGTELLRRRSGFPDIGDHNQPGFAARHGIPETLVRDLEDGKRASYTFDELADAERAYGLREGAIAEFLAGAGLAPADGHADGKDRAELLRLWDTSDAAQRNTILLVARAGVYGTVEPGQRRYGT